MHATTPSGVPSHLSTGLVSAMWRHRWLVASWALIGLVAGIALTLLRPPVYEATARLLIMEPAEMSLFGTQDGPDTLRHMQNSVERLRDDTLLAEAASLAGVQLSADAVRARVDAHVSPVSDTIAISASHRDAAVAARLADGVAEALAASLRTTAVDRAQQAMAELQPLLGRLEERIEREQAMLAEIEDPEVREDLDTQRSMALVDLHDMQIRAEQFRVDASLSNGGVAAVQPAPVPLEPASAGPVFGGALGLLLGLVVGALLAWWRAERTPEVAAPTDPELIAGLPLLGVLPVVAGRGSEVQPTAAAREVLGALRFRVPREDARRLLCTSMRPFPGRGYLTLQLAAAAAVSGQRVLVVDADLDPDGSLCASMLNGHRRRGRGEVGDASPEPTRLRLGDGGEVLLVRPDLGGAAPGSARWSEQLAAFLDDLADDGRQVFVHGPSILQGPETAELARLVDGIVVAIERNSPVEDLAAGQRRLLAVTAPTFGYVFVTPSNGRHRVRAGNGASARQDDVAPQPSHP